MLLLSKFATPFLDPLGLALLLLGISVGLNVIGRVRAAQVLAAATLLALWAASTPVLSKVLLWQFERIYPPMNMATVPVADVAIVLGGAVAPNLPPRQRVELTDASDRVLYAADLYRARKVRAVIVSGGNLPWATGRRPEAEWIADLLQEWGIPKKAIILERNSRNTYENARFTAKELHANGYKSALLVTSSYHMRRALAAFEGLGLEVYPCSTDIYVTSPISTTALDYLPSSAALSLTSMASKEFFGYIVHQVRARF